MRRLFLMELFAKMIPHVLRSQISATGAVNYSKNIPLPYIGFANRVGTANTITYFLFKKGIESRYLKHITGSHTT